MIEHVSDTAFWVARHRANESARPDALFHDPLAARLAGERGAEIARTLPNAHMTGWAVVMRTLIIDELILSAIAQGVDTVVNLGAGLDTRPYRMALPMIVAGRLSLLGRSSLTVYVAHLPLVYGWSTFAGLNARWGRSLSLIQVAGVALLLLVFGLAVAESIRTFKAWRARPRDRGPALPTVG
jgi:hypothetical protein